MYELRSPYILRLMMAGALRGSAGCYPQWKKRSTSAAIFS
ncbi:hypothetical protein SAMN04487825_10355 [Prevotella sp. kh1p2]|nr:hypothetical protein SAMN04487825_10355 [Prevotella sp. kh1p2]SNU10558.1 hypothetical protein SAMN06298210_103114 [Prevotellaceae bacterium KH2P17]